MVRSCYDTTQPDSGAKRRSAHLRLATQVCAPCGAKAKPRSGAKAIAIYHATTKPIARSAGRSAVAAAAYRAGAELVDERTGLVHDYTRKAGVVSAEIIAPDGGSADRSVLWNAAEAAENRKDARTAREWIVAIPAELDAGQRRELALSFGAQLASRYGVAVDVAIHEPDREGDNRNHHAHLLTTTRCVTRDAAGDLVMGGKASIELSDKKRRQLGLEAAAKEVKAVRQLWEQTANHALERAGRTERIDARSLKDQGIDREATTHLGPVATEMERRGKGSDRGDGNRQVLANNEQRRALSAQVVELKAERERGERVQQVDPAALASEWEGTKKGMVRSRTSRAEALGYRAYDEAERIAKQRFKMRQDHLKSRPQEPSGVLAVFKRKAYTEALAVWNRGMKAIDQWRQDREKTLRHRFKQMRDYVVGGHKVGASVDRKMQRERPEDARAVAQYERQQIEARRERQRARSRGNERGGIER